MKETIRRFYEGEGRGPRIFQVGLIVFDVVIIAYFVLTANADIGATLLSVDLAIGAVVLADLAARFWIAERRAAFMLSLTTIADIVVLLSLLAPVLTGANLGFLRALRMLRLARSFHMAERLDDVLRGSLVNSRIMVAAANLVAFIFVVTSMVWVLERQKNDDIATYVDALYFTMTTLTTTGYGDITLTDRTGRLLTIVIMVFGVGFFLNLIQAIYRPAKVEQPCPQCGLRLHDRDASHCKHCGSVIYIETEGAT